MKAIKSLSDVRARAAVAPTRGIPPDFRETERRARIERWRAAARAAAPTSREVNAEFRGHTRGKRAGARRPVGGTFT